MRSPERGKREKIGAEPPVDKTGEKEGGKEEGKIGAEPPVDEQKTETDEQKTETDEQKTETDEQKTEREEREEAIRKIYEYLEKHIRVAKREYSYEEWALEKSRNESNV